MLKPYPRQAALAALLALGLASAPVPAQAFLGAVAKVLAKGAGKSAASKGAATGAATVGAANVAEDGVQAAAKIGGAGADDAAQLSRASGLGPAVPDEVRAMLKTPGKTLADVPDPGTHAWLSTPPSKLSAADGDAMVRDYVELLAGRPAKGPLIPDPKTSAKLSTQVSTKAATETNAKAVKVTKADAPKPATTATATPAPAPHPKKQTVEVPWYAAELLVRATTTGSKLALTEQQRLCRNAADASLRQRYCGSAADRRVTSAIMRERMRQRLREQGVPTSAP
ncbi:hypothetical protein [Ottowia sp.]|uniref:hypothetical protein n=1 Tax=Ottowia sp. TaxID=1898956 RepID=UPI003A8B21CC